MTAYILHGLLLLHGLAACGLFLYGMNCYVLLFLHRRVRDTMCQHDASRAAGLAGEHTAVPACDRATAHLQRALRHPAAG